MGQVSRGLGARAPRAWGPAHQRPGAFFPVKKPPNLSNYDFFANLLVGAWRRHGCRLKRLLRRWGPGGKRSRDTPPTPPPPALGGRRFSPSPPLAIIKNIDISINMNIRNNIIIINATIIFPRAWSEEPILR